MFGIAPADELGIVDHQLRFMVNWGCYIAHQEAENQATENAQKTKENEVMALDKHLDFLKELEEASKSRGS